MKKLLILLTILFMVSACGTAQETVVEPAVNAVTTTVLPTPTLSNPRLNTEPASPTALPTQPVVIPITAEATTAPPSAPEPIPTQTAVAVVESEGGVGHGRTPEGAFYHGDPDAPIAMIDYSDFL
jgi:hypothetical protein